MAETKPEKARRYLTEGRVSIVERNRYDGRTIAYVRGDSGELHACGYDPAKTPNWRCTCQAWKLSRSKPDCSHLIAVKLVAAARAPDVPPPDPSRDGTRAAA